MPLRLDRRGRLMLSERDVQQQISDWMQLHGWREFATGYGEIKRGDRLVATVGEVGMPDRLFVRYKAAGYCELAWVELKRPEGVGHRGGRLRKAQKDWIRDETLRGAVVLVIDSLDELIERIASHFGI